MFRDHVNFLIENIFKYISRNNLTYKNFLTYTNSKSNKLLNNFLQQIITARRFAPKCRTSSGVHWRKVIINRKF